MTTDSDFANFETEMNRGFLSILVLALLETQTYGYAMVRAIRERGYEVEENTLYPLLRRLEAQGLLTPDGALRVARP